MESVQKSYLLSGFINTLYDWRYLALLFIIEIVVLTYLYRKTAKAHLVLFGLIIIHVIHEILYFFNKVPVMHWFIPVDDPFVKQVIFYQWIAYGLILLALLFLSVSRALPINRSVKIFGLRGLTSPGAGAVESPFAHAAHTKAGESEVAVLPFFIIGAFVLAQQVFGYISGYWLFQEEDTVRYLEYGKIFIEKGFKPFTDIWMVGTSHAQRFELDLPLIPLIWGAFYRLLNFFSASPSLADVTNHTISLFFWLLSLWGTYLLGKELFHQRVGAYAALLLAFIPYYSYMGYLYMIDVPLTAFVTLSIFFFIKGVKNNHVLYGFAAGILLLLAFLTKYIGLYIGWVILFAFFALRKRGEWRSLVSFGAAIVTGTCLLILFLYSMYGNHWWYLVTDYIELKRYVLNVHAFRPQQEYAALYHHGKLSFFFYVRYLTAYIGFGMMALIIVSFLLQYRGRLLEAKEHLLLFFWPLTLILFFSLLSTKTSRFIFSAYPALAILASHGYIRLRGLVNNTVPVNCLFLLILVELLGRHISYYYSTVAKLWIVGRHYIW
ncbi:MAG: ArnT family glycosyltransferase [Thermodesulfobacteriota bacterium]